MRHINYLVLLLVACCVGACSSPKNDTKDAYPMFWTWLDYQPGMNFDSICTIMNEAGIDGVMLNAPTPGRYSHRPKTWDRGLRLVMDDESGT